MRTLLLGLLTVVLAPHAVAQFESTRPLIAKADSNPVPGIPFDGLWSRQLFIGEGNSFLSPVDGGYLDTVEHYRIRWNSEQRTYDGLERSNMRVMPLGASRLLMEYDQSQSGRTWVHVVRWDGAEMHLFDFDVDDASDFARHMRANGVTMNDGVASGASASILQALRSLPLPERGHDRRWRRPNHAEMGEIWNYFEIVRWIDHQDSIVRQISAAEDSLQSLGDLHQAHYFADQAHWPQLGHLHALAMGPFEFGSLGGFGFAALTGDSMPILKRLDERIEARMKWVGEQVEVVEHIEHVDDPDDRFDFVIRADPGELLKFHMVITDNDGKVLEDTHAKGEPVIAPVMGDLPEGIQWALRTMALDEKLTLNIPPHLAFGPQFGVLRVELEIVKRLPNSVDRPPLRDQLGYYIDTVDAEETPSGLRYRDLAVGEGEPPERGRKVRLRSMAWNAMGAALGEPQEVTTTVGADDMFAGVTEALQTMSVGGQRVLFVPHQLADTSRERAGTSQCVVVELLELLD